MHMLHVMHESEPYGFFLMRNGAPVDIIRWSSFLVSAPRDIRKAIAELENSGVFSRDSYGRIFCRRMVREAARKEQALENGLLGGNPVLVNRKPSNQVNQNQANQDNQNIVVLDNQPEEIPVIRPRPRPTRMNQSPEARDQSNSDSLRSSAVAFGSWPDDVGRLRELAGIFLAAHGNCRDPVKAEKHLPAYTSVLAVMRSRGVTISVAWQACEDARVAAGGKPLFSAAVKSATAFLPARQTTAPGKPERRAKMVTEEDIKF